MTAIADPGRLEDYLPANGSVAWIRHGEGMVGLGEIARFDGVSAADADSWWREVSSRIEVVGEAPAGAIAGPVAFGSFVFDPAATASTSVMVLPRILLGRRNGQAWITVIEPLHSGGTQRPHPAPRPAVPALRPRICGASLERAEWERAVAEAVGRIMDGDLSKVVLARGLRVVAEDPFDQRHLVSALAAGYPTCWTYAVDGLVGASPEMLVRLRDGLATSRVLAGTIRRNPDEVLDLSLAHDLARDAKNLSEHELAVQSVATALAPACTGMNVPDAPYVLELPNVLHLASDVTAVARPGTSVLSLADRLHPSAAVCGTPTVLARAAIAELEHLDRGRYSGPVGWVDASGDGEFAIALRCGQIHPSDDQVLTLFAGCGIVSGSDPAEEFAETEAKLLPMLQAVGLGEAEPS